MNLTINGERRQLEALTLSLLELLEWLQLELSGIAVAVNSSVVAKTNWSATPLQEGDVVDIIQARQGG